MTFVINAQNVALTAMNQINPALSEKYACVIKFLAGNPSAASAIRGSSAVAIGTEDYIRKQAVTFSNSRAARKPAPPKTIPDEMVSIILVSYFGVAQEDVERVKREHLLSMAAENMVGELLERYLASVMEPRGWVWCSGSLVRSVDFILPQVSIGDDWRLLQVKNRDNSENSSSAAIRLGTDIKKWHRTFSRKTGTNWAQFPDDEIRSELSEDEFKRFVRGYLRTLC